MAHGLNYPMVRIAPGDHTTFSAEATHSQWRREPFESDQVIGVVENGRGIQVKLLVDYD